MKWYEERNIRVEQEIRERDAKLRAQGYKLIACVAYYDPRTGHHPMCSWDGETEDLVITNVPSENLRYGIGCILVGPDSEVLEDPIDASELALTKNGVVLTVFKGRRPK